MSQAQWQETGRREYGNAGYSAGPQAAARRRHRTGLTARDRKNILVMLIVAGILGIIIIITTAFAATINYQNNQLRNDITALEGDVEALEIDIQSTNNIANIEKRASGDLGMKYAEGGSYVVISSGGGKADDGFAAKLKAVAYN